MTQELSKYISDGVDLAKAGKAMEVYTTISPYLSQNTIPPKSHYPTGWVIYYALHQAADTAIGLRKKMLAEYLRLNVSKPHKLHSMILTEAIRLYKDARNMAFNRRPEDVVSFSISRFASLWNVTNLREGDWRRKELDGKKLSSTAEKLLSIWVDEVTSRGGVPTAELHATLNSALEKYPDTASLLYQCATLLIHEKRDEEAIPLLKKAILLAPAKHYMWSRLASLIDPAKDLKLHVALLHRALKAPGPEQFKGKVRIALAKAWISADVHPQALHELENVRRLYTLNGWHLSHDFNNAVKNIAEGTVPSDPTPAYQRIDHLADSFIYDALPIVEVRKTYHKEPNPADTGKGFGRPATAWRVSDTQGNNYWIHPAKFNINPKLPLGTMLHIRVSGGKAVKAALAPQPSIDSKE